ncbi:MAG: hypothetical protein H7175_19665 [Burkholderiales bacterium]|nr:hypothetical protein [Anaerolineae bacterium]
MSLSLNPRRIAIVLSVIAIYLGSHSIVGKYVEDAVALNRGETPSYALETMVRVFNINRESSVPTWFSSSILLAAAALLVVIARFHSQRQAPYVRHWWGLVLIFLYFSLDESAVLHEKLTEPLQDALQPQGALYFAWIIVGIAFVLVFALAYVRFWLRLPAGIRWRFLFAAALYIGGAVVIEGVGANRWYEDDGTSLIYSTIGTLEEIFEMLGVIAFIYALLIYIRDTVGEVRISVENPAALDIQQQLDVERPREIQRREE